jgi:hypothetical protein
MGEEQLSIYAMYMGTLGNRPDLFADSGYVGKYYNTEYEKYEIPPEALEDEQFAKMITEAEKYLGFPYVWGGSSPATSFDCSGFVSYVCNNCGVGWSFGRLGADGLRGICTRVSSANVRPGDLVFFRALMIRPEFSCRYLCRQWHDDPLRRSNPVRQSQYKLLAGTFLIIRETAVSLIGGIKMNPKIERLQAERQKHSGKIVSYEARIKAIDEEILSIENAEIVSAVRASVIPG